MNCQVMGIVNVTPDSFSDGGRFFQPEEAVRRVRNLIAEGADIVDLGAESTRPGATPLSWDREWERLEPVLAAFGGGRETDAVTPNRAILSVDTYHPETAERALALGVRMINCVYAEPVPKMLKICRECGAELVIPATAFDSVVEACGTDFRPWLDPMIGFGTTREEDLALLRSIPELAKKGRVLVGVSRKRIVRRLSGEHGVGKLLGGSVALAVWCAVHGASMVRVHDVRETVEALAAWSALDPWDRQVPAYPPSEASRAQRDALAGVR